MFLHKKTWTIYFVYVLSGIGKHHVILNESTAHAIWRELQLQFLITFEILPISIEQESKSGCSSYMSFFSDVYIIGTCIFY